MTRTVLGLVTVGQAPRDDVTKDLEPIFAAADVRSVQHGALDEADPGELVRLDAAGRNAASEHTGERIAILATRLRDGREIVYPEGEAVPRTAAAIARCVRDGASAVLLLCTGTFPTLQASVPVLYPDRILQNVARAVYDGGRVAILTPAEAQVASQRRRWTSALTCPPEEVCVVGWSPYVPAWRERLGSLAPVLRDAAPALVVLDCIGYDREMRAEVGKALGRQTTMLLARTVAARVAVEVVG